MSSSALYLKVLFSAFFGPSESSAVLDDNNQAEVNALPANPFSDWKSTVNLDKDNTVESNLPNDVATLILSYLPTERVQTIMEGTKTEMDRYNVYQGIMGDACCLYHNEHAKSSYTGKELEEFQRLLSLEGQAPVHRETPMAQSRIAFLTQLFFPAPQHLSATNQNTVTFRSWAELLAGDEMSLTHLKNLDLSDSPNMTDLDVIALTKSSPNLTKLILPGAFPSEEVMAVLKANCPQAAIYPSAMTEQEWAHPAEFMAKLPPPPQEIADFINSPRPIWPGKTATEAHMVMPKVNKIVGNIDGRSVMVPWTLNNINELDKAIGGVGYRHIWHEILEPANDKPPEAGFEWVVFTKDVLPESRNQRYANQKQFVEHWGYEVPGFLDATTCMLWENRLSGNRIYGDHPVTYTRCKEKFEDCQVIAGSFALGGGNVDVSTFNDGRIGAGGVKKFKV